MQRVSQKEVAYHSRPEAEPPLIDPFPPGVRWGLWFGIGVGAFLGLLFGFLLFEGILLILGWEMLFSMAPFTFYIFWVFAESAAGLLVGGLIVSPLQIQTVKVKKGKSNERVWSR